MLHKPSEETIRIFENGLCSFLALDLQRKLPNCRIGLVCCHTGKLTDWSHCVAITPDNYVLDIRGIQSFGESEKRWKSPAIKVLSDKELTEFQAWHQAYTRDNFSYRTNWRSSCKRIAYWGSKMAKIYEDRFKQN